MLKHLFFVLSVLAVAQCITDFWDKEIITTKQLFCLKEKGFLEEAFIRAEFNSNNKKWETNVEPHKFDIVDVQPHLILSTSSIQGILPPLLEARRIFMEFKNSPIKKYWVSISFFQGSFKPSCDYLRQLAFSLKRFSGKEIGFQSEHLFWQELFEDEKSCPQLSEYDLFLSFSDFKLFGGWSSFRFYQTYELVNGCGNPGMKVFKN